MNKTIVFMLFLFSLSFPLTGCIEEAFSTGDKVKSITVDPSEVRISELGSGSGFIDVTVELGVDTSTVSQQDSYVFLFEPSGQGQRRAKPQSVLASGKKITFKKIGTAWLQDFPAGTYNVGVHLSLTDGQMTVQDDSLGKLTITQ